MVRLRWPVSRGAVTGPGRASATIGPPWPWPLVPAPRLPVQHCAHCRWLALLARCVGPVTDPASVQPATANTAGAVWPGRVRARPSREDAALPGSNSAPSLAWVVGRPLGGLPPENHLAPSRSPARRVPFVTAGRLPPPPLAKLRSCVATLRTLRRRPRPPLLTPRGRLGRSLVPGHGLVCCAGRIARPTGRRYEGPSLALLWTAPWGPPSAELPRPLRSPARRPSPRRGPRGRLARCSYPGLLALLGARAE